MRILFLIFSVLFISCTRKDLPSDNQEDTLFDGLDFSNQKYSGNLSETDSIKGFVMFPRLKFNERFDTIVESDIYYGLYHFENDFDSNTFIWRKLNVLKIVKETPIGTFDFSYLSDKVSNPLFMIHGIIDTNNVVYGKSYAINELCSSDRFDFKFPEFEYKLSLKNTLVVSEKDDTLNNLSLWLNKSSEGIDIDTAICNVNQRPWSSGFEGNIGLYWVGDMDFDGLIDMVIGYSDRYNSYEYRLFISSVDEFKPVARFSYSD